MQAELNRCITTTQRALAELKLFASEPSPSLPDTQAFAFLANIAASGIPKIVDSRVPDDLSAKLHGLTETYFHKACLGLSESHTGMDSQSLRSVATQLRATYTSMYERKLVEAATLLSKPRAQGKQPYANDILLYAFDRSQTPSRRERERLAALTGMTLEQVRVWFQNRRSRSKKKAPELQTRSNMQLPDLLERVVACCKATSASSPSNDQHQSNDEHDSGYSSDPSCESMSLQPRAQVRRESRPFSVSQPTQRSYPATYVAQPLIAHGHFDPPHWRRASASGPRPGISTVTIDELCRSMAALTLRRRSAAPSIEATCGMAATASSLPAKPRKSSSSHKDPETGRRVAGARRVASTMSNPPSPSLISVSPSDALPSTMPTLSVHPRKKAGFPRRKPIGKTVSRQASGDSLASVSSSSSTSSRSTSCASDFSSGTTASDSSFTSVESASTPALHHPATPPPRPQQAYPDASLLPASCGAQRNYEIPVYDLSTACFPPCQVSESVADVSAMLADAEVHQLLRGAQAEQLLKHPDFMPPQNTASYDIDMGTLLDLGTTAFPTLEALLSDDAGVYSRLFQQPDVTLPGLPQEPSWSALGLPIMA